MIRESERDAHHWPFRSKKVRAKATISPPKKYSGKLERVEQTTENPVLKAAPEASSGLDERVLLAWRSPERLFKQRGKEFYSTIIVLGVLISVILFFIEGIMPALVVWAVIFVVWATGKTPPAESEHQITSWGIRTAGKLYRFSGMTIFWLEEKWNKTVLRVLLMAFPGQLVLLVNKEDEAKIKKILSDNRVTMQKPEPTWTDNLVKWFGEKIPLE